MSKIPANKSRTRRTRVGVRVLVPAWSAKHEPFRSVVVFREWFGGTVGLCPVFVDVVVACAMGLAVLVVIDRSKHTSKYYE